MRCLQFHYNKLDTNIQKIQDIKFSKDSGLILILIAFEILRLIYEICIVKTNFVYN